MRSEDNDNFLPILLVLLLVWMCLSGCCPTQQVIRPADTVYVPVAFTDTLTLVRVDSVYAGSSERILVRIDTVFKKAWVRVLDTVRVVVPPDTVISPVIELPPTLWNSKKFWIPFGAVGLLLGVGLCLYLIKKFKP